MDCEKFEATLLDELYDELDEVTSAAAKRHVAGCARCASLFSGLKATRRVAVLEMVEPPADLEDRILTAAKEAQKVVPIGRRVSSVVSWAGSWAMRPQTAMAALFLLMIGSSALPLKGKHAAPPQSAVTVDNEGEPVAAVTATTIDRAAAEEKAGLSKDSKVASAPAAAAAPPSYLAPPAAQPTSAASAYAQNDNLLGGLSRGGGGGQGRVNAAKPAAPSEPNAYYDKRESAYEQNAAPIAGAPTRRSYAPPGAAGAAAPASPPPPPAAQGFKSLAADGPADAVMKQQQANAPSGFDAARAAYDTGDYATATRLFDQLAVSGDLTAAVWAARSVEVGGGGCPQAVGRFDQVAAAGRGTTAGYDAMYEAAHCYRLMGQWDAARQRLNQLLLVPSHINKAQAELAQMSPKAAAKAGSVKAQQQQQTPQASPQQPPPAVKSDAF